MRLVITLCLAFILVITPALKISSAAAQGGGEKRVFASANCFPHFECMNVNNFATDDVMKIVDSCITTFFGYSSPDGFFIDSDLDNEGCLTAKPGVIPKGMGAQVSPLCCVVQQQDGTCGFHCDLVTGQ